MRLSVSKLLGGTVLTLALCATFACRRHKQPAGYAQGGPAYVPPGGQPPAGAITINGQAPRPEELARLERTYALTLPAGNYWHDPRSGLGGVWGRPAQAFAPGFDFGPVARNASNGNTGVLYNGRELPYVEAVFVASLYDIAPQYIPAFAGEYILENNGNLFRGTDKAFLGNLAELAQKKGKTKGGDSGMWCGGSNGANGQTCGNSSDGCSYVSIPSSTPSPSGVPNRIDVSSGC